MHNQTSTFSEAFENLLVLNASTSNTHVQPLEDQTILIYSHEYTMMLFGNHSKGYSLIKLKVFDNVFDCVSKNEDKITLK